jgi:hypothetical protein
MKVFLIKIYYTRNNDFSIKDLREFIVTGEDEYEAKEKIYHLLANFKYEELKIVEISTPFEIF